MRCEGWERHGGALSFGPPTWRQCENEGEVMVTFIQEGKELTMPACKECWQKAIDAEMIEILKVEPINP